MGAAHPGGKAILSQTLSLLLITETKNFQRWSVGNF